MINFGLEGLRLEQLAISICAYWVSAKLSDGISSHLGLGPVSQHMVDHILLLGVAAPLVAWIVAPGLKVGATLAIATIAQLLAIWIWHMPHVFAAAMSSPALHFLMGISLFACGVWFWAAVFEQPSAEAWKGAAALLVTGKLFCLFAAILVFTPEIIYAMPHHHHAMAGGASMVAPGDDQRGAGVIMLAICPLVYVASSVGLFARWLAAPSHPQNLIAAPLPGRARSSTH